ncbi:MAG: ABC transporter substrate-binding protein [Gemmatimonadota bacterium]
MTEHQSPPRWLRIRHPAWVLLLSGVAACARTPPPDGAVPAEAGCVLAAAPAANATGRRGAAGTGAWSSAGPGAPALVVGLPGKVDPAHAPVPRTEAERTVFAQMYQTLVAVDCRGEVRPALASSWEAADQGRRWTFHLRPARAWNGAVVGAADVAQSMVAAGIDALRAIAVVDDRTLELELSVPVTAAFFARPALAVTLADSAEGWPMGTGPYQPTSSPTFGTSGTVWLVSGSGGEVEFRTVAGDPRNAVDAGVDLLVTRDPATIEYAAATGGYRSAPLPWNRVYLLLAPGDPWQGRVVAPTDGGLEALARDAVREQARPAPFSVADVDRCAPVAVPEWPDTAVVERRDTTRARTAPGAGLESPPGERPIVYPVGDAAASALAQRLVALARAGNGPPWVPAAGTGSSLIARGLPAEAFDDALERGDGTAFLFAVRHTAAADPCDLVAEVERRAPWARVSELVPLVETRATALLRDGVAGLAGVTVDGAGTLHLRPVFGTGPRP